MVKLFGKSYGGIYNYIMHFVKHQCTWHVFILKCSCCKIRKHLEWQVNINVIHNDVLYNFYKHKQKHKQFLLLLMRYFYVHYRCGNSIICIAIMFGWVKIGICSLSKNANWTVSPIIWMTHSTDSTEQHLLPCLAAFYNPF